MAASIPNNSMDEIASSLTAEELVPSKLKCAMCDRIAFNAFKLPCCTQSICANCQSALPDTCSVCGHNPLSAEDATPLKNVRLTVEQFLKNIKKKREKLRAATSSDTPAPAGDSTSIPAAAVEATPTLAAEPSTTQATKSTPATVDAQPQEIIPEADPTILDIESYWSDSNKTPLPRIPTPAPGQYDARTEHNKALEEKVADENRELLELEASADIEQAGEQTNNDAESLQENDGAESDTSDIQIVTGDEDAKAVTEFPDEEVYNEDWNGQYYNAQMNGQGQGYPDTQFDILQMGAQMGMTPEMTNFMMQQMQNGGFQNMMNTIPGMMGMDPMAMSAMFGQFGMQGMNGMNPNMMNMNGMNGMMGMDFSNNYGAWNGHQMGGDFGASSGYYPGGGYNQSHQGNFPHMSHHQQFSKNNFHNQNRFSGPQRGSGRGYHNQGYHGRNQSQNMPLGDGPPIGAPTGPKAQQQGNEGAFYHHAPLAMHNRSASKAGSSDEQRGSISHQGSVNGSRNEGPLENGTNDDNNAQIGTINRDAEEREQALKVEEETNGPRDDNRRDEQSGTPGNNLNEQEAYSNDNSNWAQSNGPSNEGYNQEQRQYGRGGFRGRGGFESRGSFRGRGGPNWQHHGGRGPEAQSSPAEPLGVGVQGAPTGPKALREGNSWGGRGRGGLNGVTRGHSQSVSSMKPDEYDHGTLHANPPAHTPSSVPISHPRSHSRSPVRDKSRSVSRHASRRNRSRTPASDNDERRRDRKRHRSSRKHEDDYDDVGHDDRREREDESSRHHKDSIEDEYHSSRRENDRRRASKTHRESSKDRRRHRRRSRSHDRSDAVYDEAHMNGDIEDSKDKERRRDKDKYRDRSRDKDRHRSRGDRDKKRSSRRDRSGSRDSNHQRSSRHSKRDKDTRDTERAVHDKDRSDSRDDSMPKAKTSAPPTPTVMTQLQQGFRIHGRSKDRAKTDAVKIETPIATTPTTDDTTMAPPTGPRAERGPAASKFKLDLASLNTKVSPAPGPRGSATSSRRPSQPATPTSAVTPKNDKPSDPYAEERRKAQEARINKELSRRKTSETTSTLSRKRSWADTAVGEDVPTGPREKKGKKSRRESEEFGDRYR